MSHYFFKAGLAPVTADKESFTGSGDMNARIIFIRFGPVVLCSFVAIGFLPEAA